MKINWRITRFSHTFILFLVSVISYAQIPAGYYDNAQGLSGDQLKAALNTIISGHTTYPYTSSTSTDVWDILKEADRDPDNPDNVIGIYSGFSMNAAAEYDNGAGWSREHVWAKSRGDFGTDEGPGTDLHHLRAEDVSTNSARNNRNFGYGTSFYVDGSGTYSGATLSKTSSTEWVWEPRDEVKGDVARMIFYMATRYEGNNGEPDLELTDIDQSDTDTAPLHARLTTLLEWNTLDPVSSEEQARNEIVYSYQHNRNPFIDHPEYVGLIWGGDAVATVNVTSSLTDFGDVAFGETSATQSYGVDGTDLTEDIVITSTNGFEISLTDVDADFTTSLNLSPTGGTVNTTTIFVRFKPESNSNGPVEGTIVHASSGASTVTLGVSGSEALGLTDPVITVDASLTDFGTVDFGETSAAQTYSVEGSNLSEDIAITSNSGFEISLTDVDADFTTSLNLSPTSGTVNATTIFVRFKPISNSNGPVNGTIAHASSGAANVVLNVSGSETSDVVVTPKINFSFSERTIDPVSQYEVQLFSDVAPPVDLSVKIGLLGASNLVYGETYTTTPALSNGELLLNWASGETNASFFIDFQEDQLDLTNPGSLSFVVNEGDGYTLGTNTQFGLNLKAQDVVTGILEPNTSEAKLYPNPAHGIVYLATQKAGFHFVIIDVTGHVVMQGEAAGESPINVSNLRPGSYIFRLIHGEKQGIQKLLIY